MKHTRNNSSKKISNMQKYLAVVDLAIAKPKSGRCIKILLIFFLRFVAFQHENNKPESISWACQSVESDFILRSALTVCDTLIINKSRVEWSLIKANKCLLSYEKNEQPMKICARKINDY